MMKTFQLLFPSISLSLSLSLLNAYRLAMALHCYKRIHYTARSFFYPISTRKQRDRKKNLHLLLHDSSSPPYFFFFARLLAMNVAQYKSLLKKYWILCSSFIYYTTIHASIWLTTLRGWWLKVGSCQLIPVKKARQRTKFKKLFFCKLGLKKQLCLVPTLANCLVT